MKNQKQVIFNYKKENVDYSLLTEYLVKEIGERLKDENYQQNKLKKMEEEKCLTS